MSQLIDLDRFHQLAHRISEEIATASNETINEMLDRIFGNTGGGGGGDENLDDDLRMKINGYSHQTFFSPAGASSKVKNVILGDLIGRTDTPTQFTNNILAGNNILLEKASSAYHFVAIGSSISNVVDRASHSVAIGSEIFSARPGSTTGHNIEYSIGIGNRLAYGDPSNRGISFSVLLGYHSADAASTIENSVCIGRNNLTTTKSVLNSVVIGDYVSYTATAVQDSVSIGSYAGKTIKQMTSSVAIGRRALQCATAYGTGATDCVAIGSDAMGIWPTSINNLLNSTALGHGASITGNNQVQLGNSSTTVYAYGAVQNRSDARDKANITDLEYPYKEFILGLRPVTFQWDYREDYRTKPDTPDTRSLREITHDGTNIRNRRHNGFIAQEVKTLMDSLGFDFAGYQDHSVNDGEDVLTLGYTEFIPPMVKMIQYLYHENQELKARLQKFEETFANI